MIKKVYITGTEAHSGKSVITIGLVNMLLGKAQKVVFFKPISSHNGLEKTDYHIETILNYFDLPVKYEDAYACTWEKAVCQWETEKQGELLDTIIQKFRRLEEKYDFTVVEGTDYPNEGCAFEFEMNLQIAKNLRAPVIIIFPDLNSGNNIYKAIQRETGALAIGPILQGLRKPVNDLSRGCTVDDVFNTVIITAIQCQDIQ